MLLLALHRSAQGQCVWAASTLVMLLAACGASQEAPNTAATAASQASASTTDCAGQTPCPKLPSQCRSYLDAACKAVGQNTSPCKHLAAAVPFLPPEACTAAMKHLDYTQRSAAGSQPPCEILTHRLCAALGPDTATCQLVREQTPSFPDERCDGILRDHYDEILSELQQREAANRPLSTEKWASATSGNAPSFGPMGAKVVLVEFSDFQCPYCARAADVARKVKEQFGDKVRFVFRQFPLEFHEHAPLAAQAALAAHAQGKFWEFHDALFQHQDQLAREDLEVLATTLGLNTEAFKSALSEGTYKAAVDSDYALGASLPVLGTPTLFLNGARVENPTDFGELAGLIEQKLAE